MSFIRHAARGTDAAAAAPLWILRHHTPSPIHALRLVKIVSHGIGNGSGSGSGDSRSRCQERVYVLAGDAEGRVSLTALADVRPRLFWKAHSGSVLGVDVADLGDGKVAILTQGRDNELVAWRLATSDASLMTLPSRIQADLPVPERMAHVGINALNYCPFSAISAGDGTDGVLVAVPHTLDSGYVDIVHLPSGERRSRAVGKPDIQATKDRAPMVMSVHLFKAAGNEQYRVAAGYEDGYVKMWAVRDNHAELQWSQRKHSESIMATALSADLRFIVSAAADDEVVLYRVEDGVTSTGKCNSMGHASVIIHRDGRRIAVGGWDGHARIFDATLKQLAKLRYHKDTVQAIATLEERHVSADWREGAGDIGDDSDVDSDAESEGNARTGNADELLVTGGKEGRICLWQMP